MIQCDKIIFMIINNEGKELMIKFIKLIVRKIKKLITY